MVCVSPTRKKKNSNWDRFTQFHMTILGFWLRVSIAHITIYLSLNPVRMLTPFKGNEKKMLKPQSLI